MKRTVEDIIAIGQDLKATKDRLPHGAFLPWIEAEFGMTDRSAARFISVADTYGGKIDIMSNLSPTVLYELAAPSTPEPVRQVVEAKAASGESVSVAEVQRLKREAAEAIKRANDATAEAERQREKADTLAEGQRSLVDAARDQAAREAAQAAAADLAKARSEAELARSQLADQRAILAKATEKAEAAAMAKAKAEAQRLAADELARVQSDAAKAKQEEAKARENVERLSERAERFRKQAEEHDAFLRARTNGELEAKAIREHLEGVNRVLALAMVEVSDLEHEPPQDVQRLISKTAKMCRDFSQALDTLGGPVLVYERDGAQA
nr:DUF3102 domain-containing protein [Rhodobacter sp. NTK016B]